MRLVSESAVAGNPNIISSPGAKRNPHKNKEKTAKWRHKKNLKKPSAKPVRINRRSQRPLKLTPELGEEANYAGVMGGNSLVHHGSDYMIPLQLTQPRASNSEPVAAQRKDEKSDFLPVYETVCKFTNAAGAEGRHVLEQELNALRDKQLEIIAKKKEPTCGKDAYSKYMHLYESLCGYANDAGEEG